jgi:SNF2 family DNA or RNA helicase
MLDTNINKYLNNTNTKYLFQLCTNLLIKDYFNVIYKSKIDGIQSTDDLEKSETITLDKLQSFMASKFTNLIAKSQKDLDHLTTIHEKCSTRIVELNSLKFAMQSFFEGYNFKGLPPPSVSNLCKSVAVINIHKHKYFDRFAHLREYVITRILDNLTTIGTDFIKLLEIFQEEFIEFVIGNSYKKIDECTFEELVKLEEELEEIRYITEHHNIISLYNYLSSFYEDIVNLLTLANSEAKIFLYYSCISSYLQTYNPVSYNEKIAELKSNIDGFKRQLALFSGQFIIEQTQEPCMICYDTLNKIVVPQCRHIFCEGCYRIFLERSGASKRFPCPACRQEITTQTVIRTRVKPEDETEKTPKLYTKKVVINGIELKPIWKYECINQYGSKMSVLLEYLGSILLEPENKVIIFSQYNSMLVLIGKVLDTYGIQHVNCKGSVHNVSKGVMNFKKTPSIKVIMLSSETANSGNNLTEANHVIFIDVLNHPKLTVMDIEKQAVGRTVRLGQHKGVVVTRFIMRNTIEEFTYNANKYDMATLQ